MSTCEYRRVKSLASATSLQWCYDCHQITAAVLRLLTEAHNTANPRPFMSSLSTVLTMDTHSNYSTRSELKNSMASWLQNASAGTPICTHVRTHAEGQTGQKHNAAATHPPPEALKYNTKKFPFLSQQMYEKNHYTMLN